MDTRNISRKETTMYHPLTGAHCSCTRGVQRDNCPTCEGTGLVVDFAAIRARTIHRGPDDPGRPHVQPLPTCAECLARVKYVADLDTDGQPLTVFDCEPIAPGLALTGRMHLYISRTLGDAPIALCRCDTRLRWLEPTAAGHGRAWSALKARYGSYDCPHDGEVWQYVGTSYPTGHGFRHRTLPPVNDRCAFHVPELPGDWAPAVDSSDIPGEDMASALRADRLAKSDT